MQCIESIHSLEDLGGLYTYIADLEMPSSNSDLKPYQFNTFNLQVSSHTFDIIRHKDSDTTASLTKPVPSVNCIPVKTNNCIINTLRQPGLA